MRALVTGASGFVGRHLVAHLEAEGDTVVGLDRNGPDPGDITDAVAVATRVTEAHPDVVFHLAALTYVPDSWEQRDAFRAVNVDGTRNVVDACADTDVRAVIVIGSAEQYGAVADDALPIAESATMRPISPYAESKVAAEQAALDAYSERGVPVIAVRAFNHTGPGQSSRFLVPALASRIVEAEREQHRAITVGNLEPVRDVSDVRDVVRAYRMLALHGDAGATYNVCSGRGVSVRAIVFGLLSMAHRELEVTVDPDLVRPVDVPALVGDSSKIRYATGWAPEIDLTRTLWEVLAETRSRVA
ncbi:MAG: GDP-mannose 4,6-dehydratase [Acidimicrobiia bacterium]